MISFVTIIHRFEKQGEKTGWTYIEIPADLAQKIKPGNKKSFRVKGRLDKFAIKEIALLPMGGGSFIMAINASMRKGIGKRHGAMLKVEIEEDKSEPSFDKDLIECLREEPEAIKFFNQLSKSNQNYYSKWIASAKTVDTKAKRIAQCVAALLRKQHYGEMIRWLKDKKPQQ